CPSCAPPSSRPVRACPSRSTSTASCKKPSRTFTTACPSTKSTSRPSRSEEHTSELQSRENLVCRLLLEKKKRIHEQCQTHTIASVRSPYSPLAFYLRHHSRVPPHLHSFPTRRSSDLLSKLRTTIVEASQGLPIEIDVDGILQETVKNLYDGVPVDEVYKSAI